MRCQGCAVLEKEGICVYPLLFPKSRARGVGRSGSQSRMGNGSNGVFEGRPSEGWSPFLSLPCPFLRVSVARQVVMRNRREQGWYGGPDNGTGPPGGLGSWGVLASRSSTSSSNGSPTPRFSGITGRRCGTSLVTAKAGRSGPDPKCLGVEDRWTRVVVAVATSGSSGLWSHSCSWLLATSNG